MPFVRISIAGPAPGSETARRLQRETTALMAGILGKQPELTVVRLEAAPAHLWAGGGAPLPDGVRAAQLEAVVTAGTNTAEEKARFVAAAYGLLRETLGDLGVPTYVMVTETPATDWGYDGRTQAGRRP